MWLRPPRLHKSAVSCDVHHGNVDRPSSSAGRHLLCGHLLTLPDNKIVEDVHQPIRLHGKGNVNRKQKSLRIQDIIANSRVLEQRGVRNVGAVDKTLFLKQYTKTKRVDTSRLFKCRTHKLPVEWARMCHYNKTWASWSEDTIQKAAAAWHWLHYYLRELHHRNGSLVQARLARDIDY